MEVLFGVSAKIPVLRRHFPYIKQKNSLLLLQAVETNFLPAYSKMNASCSIHSLHTSWRWPFCYLRCIVKVFWISSSRPIVTSRNLNLKCDIELILICGWITPNKTLPRTFSITCESTIGSILLRRGLGSPDVFFLYLVCSPSCVKSGSRLTAG